ncbi:unnamed protein product [Caenorhabditis nigoni]
MNLADKMMAGIECSKPNDQEENPELQGIYLLDKVIVKRVHIGHKVLSWKMMCKKMMCLKSQNDIRSRTSSFHQENRKVNYGVRCIGYQTNFLMFNEENKTRKMGCG